MRRRAPLLLLLSLLLCAPVACRSRGAPRTNPAGKGQPAPSLAGLLVKDDSSGLTFSYVTLEGAFRQVTRVADVPYESRDAVRVWSTVSGDGVSGPYIYLADLRTPLGDGSYKVEVVPRAQFEELAAARRDRKAVAAAPPGAGAGAGAAGAGEPGGGPTHPKGGQKGALTVVIYGADWCKPCHDAERYLTTKGVPYVHKDVEDPGVSEEMGAKLQAAGLKTHNIPVIDVGGKILVGFSASDLDRALSDATR